MLVDISISGFHSDRMLEKNQSLFSYLPDDVILCQWLRFERKSVSCEQFFKFIKKGKAVLLMVISREPCVFASSEFIKKIGKQAYLLSCQ